MIDEIPVKTPDQKVLEEMDDGLTNLLNAERTPERENKRDNGKYDALLREYNQDSKRPAQQKAA